MENSYASSERYDDEDFDSIANGVSDGALPGSLDGKEVDFSKLQYRCYSFNSILGGLSRADFVEASSPIKAKPREPPPTEPNSALKPLRNTLSRSASISRNNSMGEKSDKPHGKQRSTNGVISSDFITTNFKWAPLNQEPVETCHICPRSTQASECNICRQGTSYRGSKLNWKSIYEVNLSLSVPLIPRSVIQTSENNLGPLRLTASDLELGKSTRVRLDEPSQGSQAEEGSVHPSTAPLSKGSAGWNKLDRRMVKSQASLRSLKGGMKSRASEPSLMSATNHTDGEISSPARTKQRRLPLLVVPKFNTTTPVL